MDAWRAMIAAQGGDPDATLPVARETHVVDGAGRRACSPGSTRSRSASPPGGWAPAGPARRTRCRPAPASCCWPSPATRCAAGEPLLELHTDDAGPRSSGRWRRSRAASTSRRPARDADRAAGHRPDRRLSAALAERSLRVSDMPTALTPTRSAAPRRSCCTTTSTAGCARRRSSSWPTQIGYDACRPPTPTSSAQWFRDGRRLRLAGALPGDVRPHRRGDADRARRWSGSPASAPQDLAADGVVYAEIRYAPEQHLERGLTLDRGRRGGASTGSARASARRPQRGNPIRVGALLTAMRHAARVTRDRRAGRALPRRRAWSASTSPAPRPGFPPTRHLDAFEYLRRENAHFTIHAGEAFGLPSIWEAIQWCGADRLGHGVRIVDDIGSARPGATPRPRAVELGPAGRAYVRDKRIPLEMCPSSNVQTGAAASIAEHPIGLLRRLRFRVTVNTDNRLMSGTSMTREMALLVEAFGYAGRPALVHDQRDEERVHPVRRAARADQRRDQAGVRRAGLSGVSHAAVGHSLDRASSRGASRPKAQRCGGIVVCRGRAERHPDQLRGSERPGAGRARVRRGGRRGRPPRLARPERSGTASGRCCAGRLRRARSSCSIDGPDFQFVVPCAPAQLARARSFATAICAAGARPADAPIRRGAGPGFPRAAITEQAAGAAVQPASEAGPPRSSAPHPTSNR